MKGDFSRQTFRKGKRYSAVLAQQGRVQLDADVNELQAIQRHHAETTAADTIGPRGAPKVGGGFQVGLTADGRGLVLSPGRLYVDGILCEQAPTEYSAIVLAGDGRDVQLPTLVLDGWRVAAGQLLEVVADDRAPQAVSVTSIVNEGQRTVRLSASVAVFRASPSPRIRRRVTLDTQPDFFEPVPANLQNGRHLVYLEVWQRHLTALEDPEIRESALGGPDTTTRTKTVWQAKLLKVPNTATCGQLGNAFPPEPTLKGRMTPGTTPLGEDEGPCVLPPTAGYHRLENQLYRVEVHRGGPRNQATFKWSRENGSVVAPLESLSGQVARVASNGHDGLASFDDDHWVEILDDRLELNARRGRLARVRSLAPARREIELEAAGTPLPSFGAADQPWHPKLRRWDQAETVGTEDGIPMTARVDLEGGISVEFSDGEYVAGDFWLIPARTGRGDIEWPRAESGEYLAQPPQGIARHYCPLALVDVNAGVFALLPGGASDCRPLFPALTAIAASDVSFDNTICSLDTARTVQQALDLLCQRSTGLCTATATPGPGWEAVFARIPDGQDGQICFPVGVYPVTQPVVVRNKGRLTIAGVGPGSRLESTTSERLLAFETCQSVTVRDLGLTSTAVVTQRTPQRVGGVLTFVDCDAVNVERVTVNSGAGGRRAAACLAAQETRAARGGTVRIRECTLGVGFEQVGILLVNVDRAQVEDNILRALARPPALTFQQLIQVPEYRTLLRDMLIANARFGNEASRGPATNDSVTVGGVPVVFSTHSSLVGEWGTVFRAENPPGVVSPQTLIRYLKSLADRVLLTGGANRPLFINWVNQARNQLVVSAGQGIVIGGTRAREVRILNNTVTGIVDAIHVGVSHQTIRPTPEAALDRAEVIRIAGNNATATLTALAGRARSGIFVGNFSDSLIVENNTFQLGRLTGTTLPAPAVEGVRVYGVLGRMLLVRQNYLEGFTTGVRVQPLRMPAAQTNLWAVTDNMLPGATTRVAAPGVVRTTTPAAGTNENVQ